MADIDPQVVSLAHEADLKCHCGRLIHVYNEPGMEGFTRDMCLDCSTVRCDIEPGACVTTRSDDALTESRDWWKSEWEHKDREANGWFLVCLVMAALCGVAFFVGTVVG